MTTSMQKQHIKQTWDVKKLQEAATRLLAQKAISRLRVTEKAAGKEICDMEKAAAHLRAEVLKTDGVNTPMALVKHIAELECNLFGAEVSIQGDEHKAILINDKPTVWLEVKRIGKLTKEQEVKLQEHHRHWIEELANGFGYKAEFEITNDGNGSKITVASK